MMKSESCSEVIKEYASFKKDVLYCLLANDGLGLLESGIFQRFERTLFGFELHSATHKLPAHASGAEWQRQPWSIKSISLDEQTTLNIVEQLCYSDRPKATCQPFRDLTYYQQTVEQLQQTIFTLKNENLRQFIYFQNALLLASRRDEEDMLPSSYNNNSAAHPESELSLTESTPSKPSSERRKRIELTASPHEGYSTAHQDGFEDDEAMYDLPLQVPTTTKLNSSSINDLSQIIFQPPAEVSLENRLNTLFRTTLASNGYDYQQCQGMPLFSTLFANIGALLKQEMQVYPAHAALQARHQACLSCADQLNSAQRSSGVLATKRQLEQREKEIGKRELMLILKEKSLSERRAELEVWAQEFKSKEEHFLKDIQRRLGDIERLRNEIEEQRRDLCSREQALEQKEFELSTSLLNLSGTQLEGDYNRKRFELLKEKVRFEEVKRQTYFTLDQQNDALYQNVLPGLRMLHARMKGSSHEQSLMAHK